MKPFGPAHEWCPFWKRPCNKVCHTCPLWQPVEFDARLPSGESKTEVLWNCSLAWATTIALDTGKRVERVTKEQEALRKSFDNVGGTMGAIVGGVVEAQQRVMARPLKEITNGE